MGRKQVLFDTAARQKILQGASLLADAVPVTLGPRSTSVLIERKGHGSRAGIAATAPGAGTDDRCR